MIHKTKHKIHVLLHPELGDSHYDRAFNAFIIVLILLNVIAVMLETVPSIYEPNKDLFYYFDVISVAIFSIEYILTVWSITHDPKYKHPVYGRLKYMVSPAGLIDLMAILPFYLHAIMNFDLRVLRMFRLFRFLRLFRLTGYMKATKLISNVFKASANLLALSLVLGLTLIIIASSIVYFAEHIAQPDVFTSIPQTMWWSVITLTTVGYGDMIPITITGRIFTSCILFAGVALLALPAGILTAGFLEETRKSKTHHRKVCPHCHMPLETEEHLH